MSTTNAIRTSGRTTVLLTGFGPFPRVPVNATMRLVPELAEKARVAFPGVAIVTEILPTEWVAAPERLAVLLRETEPDVSIHFGVSPRARGFEIETRAVNRCAIAADACGAMPANACVDPDGPDHLRTRLPAAEIVRRLRAQGIPAFQSRDAGTYLCNAILYTALDHVRGSAQNDDTWPKCGFVHIPAQVATATGRQTRTGYLGATGAPRMSWEQTLAGGLEIIRACFGRR
jgi:pyroglutamyl-peptidase